MKAGATARAPRRWPLVLLFYLGLGLALTWPLVTRLATDLPGGAHKDGLEDAYQNVWNLWWTVEALTRPTNLWVTDRLFYPDGPTLLYHTLSPANTLMAAPVTALWGPIAGFNAVALASFALGGLGMWLLARGRAGPGPAILAGIVYVASPFHLAAIVTDGQLQIFAHQWLPWYISFLLEALEGRPQPQSASAGGPRAGAPQTRWAAPTAPPRGGVASYRFSEVPRTRPAPRRRGWRDAALAGLFLVLTAWTDWYYTLFLLIFTAGALAWLLWRSQGGGLAAMARQLAIVAGVFALGAGPLVAPMLVEAARADYMSILPPADPGRLSADLLAYLVPPRIHALWGAAPWDWGVSYEVNRRFFPGLAVLALAALALWRRPASRPWGLAALAFGVLSLGASLRVNGVDTGLPLPYGLIAELPIVRLTRQPDRLNALVTVALGVLTAHGAAALAQLLWPLGRGAGPGRAARHSALYALLAAILLLEYWPSPIVTRAPAMPPYLAALPATAGALVEYPFHVERPYRDAERMLFQTGHGRPISGGYHSRAYPQPQLGLPALRDLRAGRLDSDIVRESAGWASALGALGYTQILGYKQQPLGPLGLGPEDEGPFRALVEAGLGVSGPAYEDEWLIAYTVPPAEPSPMVQIREGWGPVEEPSPGARYRWLSESAELGLIVPEAGTYSLSFGAIPAGGPRTLRVERPGGGGELPLAPSHRRYRLLLQLPAGRTIIGLSTAEPPTSGQALEGNGDTRPISVRVDAVELAPAGQQSGGYGPATMRPPSSTSSPPSARGSQAPVARSRTPAWRV